MECPYKHHTSLKQLPCSWISHPHNENCRICDVCQNHYDVREINSFPPVLGLIAIAIATLILSNVILADPDPQPASPTNSEYSPTEAVKRTEPVIFGN